MTTETTNNHSPSPANTPLALKLTEGLGPLPEPDVPLVRGGCYTEALVRKIVTEKVAAERERAASVCDDEYRIRAEAGQKHPLYSESRGRCNAAARAARSCALGVRGGEVV